MADVKKIVRERIIYLFRQAETAFKEGRGDLAKRYVSIARKLSMKNKISMPKEVKRSFCKECGAFWVQNTTVMKRLKKKDKRIIYTCLVCGACKRVPYYSKNKVITFKKGSIL